MYSFCYELARHGEETVKNEEWEFETGKHRNIGDTLLQWSKQMPSLGEEWARREEKFVSGSAASGKKLQELAAEIKSAAPPRLAQ